MKCFVVTDKSGRILATVAHPDEAGSPAVGGPQVMGFVPLADQQVHTIAFPKELSKIESLVKIHETHRVATKGGKAQLV